MKQKQIIEIDTDDERLTELQKREPEKTAAQLLDDAVEFYRLAHKPWVTLAEAEDYRAD